MKLKSVFGLIALALLVAFCDYGEVFKTYSYKDKWQINYPPYMRKTTYIYPGAEFQVRNNYRGVYMFAKEIYISNDSTNLLDSLSNELQSNLIDPRVKSDSTYTLNGNTFRTQEITGILNDENMLYLISLIQNGDKEYYYSGWMFKHRKEEFFADFEKALHSWKKL